MISKIENVGFKYIENLKYIIKQLWEKCCEYDNIPKDSKFVVFSKNNPYEYFYEKAFNEYMYAIITTVPGGGYTGLIIKNGKAIVT